MEFNTIILFVCALLLVFLLVAEWRRANRSRRIWRLLATLIATSCFALLIVPVSYTTHFAQQQHEVVLITEGTNIDSIKNIKAVKYQLGSENALTLKKNKATAIADLSYFLAAHPDLQRFQVYGYGLSDAALESMKGRKINFHPSPSPQGIVVASWPAKIKSTSSFNVQGSYHNGGKATTLSLKGLGNVIDSVLINPNTTATFHFKSRPKQLGKAVFELIALQDGDTLTKDPVPFQVVEQIPMKVLLLASFPDFEYKFLKRWLYDQHYPVAFRSQISKDKFTTDFLNMESVNLGRISTATLQKFDVLIIDEEELLAIASNERAAIESAVQNGLGLLIRVSSAKRSTMTLLNRTARVETLSSKEKTLNLTVKSEAINLAPLALEQTIFLKGSLHDQVLISDKNGRILVNNQLNGAGKVSTSAIAATYNWMLAGKKSDYSNFWSAILTATARKQKENIAVQVSPKFPNVLQKTRFTIGLAESNKMPRLKTEGVSLSLRQNMELPFEWDAFFWPTQQGWHQLEVNQQHEFYYVYQNHDWLALKNEKKRLATLRFAATTKTPNDKPTMVDQTTQKEVSKWWFFVGFLCAAGFLWQEARIPKQK
jgi:hypothetical protein